MPVRLRAFNVLIDLLEPGKLLPDVQHIFDQPSRSCATEFRGAILASLGRLDDPKICASRLAGVSKTGPLSATRAVELLTQRTSWSRALMEAVGKGIVPASAVNVNQIRLARIERRRIVEAGQGAWGILRETRNPAREHVIRDVARCFGKRPATPSPDRRFFDASAANATRFTVKDRTSAPRSRSTGAVRMNNCSPMSSIPAS